MTAPLPPKLHGYDRRLFNVYHNHPNLISINTMHSGLNNGFNSYLGGVYFVHFELTDPGRFRIHLRNYDQDVTDGGAADGGSTLDVFKIGKFPKVSLMVDNFLAPNVFKQGMALIIDPAFIAQPEFVYWADNVQVALPATAAICAEIIVTRVAEEGVMG